VLLTTSEVAQRFKVDSSAVRRWVSEQRLKPAITTPGGHYRFNEADVDAFASHREAS
jgi:excisionase family DNA binding protein